MDSEKGKENSSEEWPPLQRNRTESRRSFTDVLSEHQKIETTPKKARMYAFLGMLTFFLAFMLYVTFDPTMRTHMGHFVEWLRDQPDISMILYIIVGSVAVLIGFPLTVLEIICAMIYPMALSLVICIVSRVLVISISYIIAVTMMKDNIDHYASKKLFLLKMKMAIAESEVKFVFLIRLIFIPMFIKNYVLPTAVLSFVKYFATSMVAGIPGLIVNTLIGANADNIWDILNGENDEGAAGTALLAFGVAMIFVFVFFIVLLTRKVREEVGKYDAGLERAHSIQVSHSTNRDPNSGQSVAAGTGSAHSVEYL